MFSLLLKKILPFIIYSLLLLYSNLTFAEVEIKMDATIIKGNTELPKILYIVPWKEIKQSKSNNEQQLIIHSLYGDLFDPVIPKLTNIVH